MKIARFLIEDRPQHTVVEKDGVRIINNSIFEDNLDLSKDLIKIDELRVLAPVVPSKIVCAGLNYKDHALELNMGIPSEPTLFLKPPSSVIAAYENIVYPDSVTRLDYEAELAIIIKKKAKDVSVKEAGNYILGFTCLNDITARDLQEKDIQWTRAKSFDTFCPLGPYIVSGIDPSNLKIELKVNDLIRQSSSTKNMIFSIDYLLSFVSKVMTLLPGDVITTGTPKGVGELSKGDRVEVDIEGIGTLKNQVI